MTVRRGVPNAVRRVLPAAALLLGVAGGAAAQDAGLAALLRNLPGSIPFPSDRVLLQQRSAYEARSDKIDPLLLRLSDEVSTRGMSALSSAAAAYRVDVSRGLVSVKLFAEDRGAAQDLAWRVRDEGGIVDAVFENVVLARVPAGAVEEFGDDRDLYYMTAQATFAASPPGDAAARGGPEDGVRAINAERLHRAGVTGENVKVGVIDLGFQGYGALERLGFLPRPAAQRAFNEARQMENGNHHGTACAEIIHAVAPGARLYLAVVDGRESQVWQAMQWLALEQDVDIISFSAGTHSGPHDGTAVLDRMVDDIVARTGVLWVNAAGNEGARHWSGQASDRDRDGAVELGGRWPGVAFRATGNHVAALVNWDDWGSDAGPAATQDIDAFLYEVDPRSGRLREPPVAQSIRPQQGRGSPLEYVEYSGARPGQEFVLTLRATRLSRPVTLHVYETVPNRARSVMQPVSTPGSIGIPATAESALAVGAVHVVTGRLEDFSSQGPTDDGRVKPEVSAPDNTVSRATDDRFSGTSGACPHVSGFAALLKQLHPSADGEALTRLVLRHVRPMGGRTPNNEYGAGHIDGSGVDVSGVDPVRPDPYPYDDFLELPDFLGGRTSARTLDALWNRGSGSDRDSRLGVRARLNYRPGPGGAPPRYRIGDPMKVGFATDERCRYALIHRDARGEYRLMSGDSAPALVPDEPRLLPEGRNQTFTIGEPVGDEGFMVVCARREVDLDAWVDRGGSASNVGVAVAEYRVER